jgi:hypothetical protein
MQSASLGLRRSKSGSGHEKKERQKNVEGRKGKKGQLHKKIRRRIPEEKKKETHTFLRFGVVQ